VEGPWQLGCPVEGEGPSCYLDVPKQDYSLSTTKSLAALTWEDKFKGEQEGKVSPSSVLNAMLENRDHCEWHLDGNMEQWIDDSDMLYRCNAEGSTQHQSLLQNSLRPHDDLIKEVCAAAGRPTVSIVDFVKYVAQKVTPFHGETKQDIDAAKQFCKESWDGKTTLGIHVRRGDKLNHEDRLYHVSEYLVAAKKNGWDFAKVLIMTDDPSAVAKEAEELKLDYFLTAGRRSEGHGNPANVQRSRSFYESNALLLREVACISTADYFVGQVNSNIAWLVQQERDIAQPIGSAIDLTSGRPLRRIV